MEFELQSSIGSVVSSKYQQDFLLETGWLTVPLIQDLITESCKQFKTNLKVILNQSGLEMDYPFTYEMPDVTWLLKNEADLN